VQPVGGRPVRLDVRIVAATHRDLAAAARDGGFRQDLYYRLNVVPIHLPPLRERRDDILPLARHFLRRAVADRRPPDLAADARDLLLRHAWPGNVRELRNAMERVAVLCRAEAATAADLDFLAGAEPVPEEAEASDLPTAVARLEARLIGRALREAGGNRAEAARRLGIHRQLLYAKARRYGLLAPDLSEEQTPPVTNGDSGDGDGPVDERE
jgi:DNA-binding NtrC family response regulator